MKMIAMTFADGLGSMVRLTTLPLSVNAQQQIEDRIRSYDPRAAIQWSNNHGGLIILPSRPRTTGDELRQSYVMPVAELLGLSDAIQWTDELYARLD